MVKSETSFFVSVSSGKFEAIPDDLTPEEILEQAQRAAQAAAEHLTLKRPNTNVCG
jgi:bromodomain-containing protein 7/9